MSQLLRHNDPIHGFWSATGHPAIVDLASSLQPDFVCLDAQHGAHISQLTAQTFTALAHYEVPGLVRVARNDPSHIGRALDLGAAGVMVPMIETAQDARSAAASFSYGPDGTRSYGMQTTRIDPLAQGYQPLCAVQIETAAAVENIEEIAAVKGIDWLYIGPADLGLGLGGIPGTNVIEVFEGSHPLAGQLQEAFSSVVSAASKNSKLAGLHCGSGEATQIAQEHGFSVSTVAADVSEMSAGMSRQLEIARLRRSQDADH